MLCYACTICYLVIDNLVSQFRHNTCKDSSLICWTICKISLWLILLWFIYFIMVYFTSYFSRVAIIVAYHVIFHCYTRFFLQQILFLIFLYATPCSFRNDIEGQNLNARCYIQWYLANLYHFEVNFITTPKCLLQDEVCNWVGAV